MTEQDAIRIAGAPLPGALVAMRLGKTDQSLNIFFDLADLEQAEGELFPLQMECGAPNPIFASLVTAEFPGFIVINAAGEHRFNHPLGLVDPIQCRLELEGMIAGSLADAPPHAREVIVPAFDPVVKPSKALLDPEIAKLALPVIFKALPDNERYEQYIPLAEGMVMVRERRGCFGSPDSFFVRHRAIAG